MSFVHLHNHTEYSLLDGAARISKLIKTAREHGAPAAAITDHGNMYGTYKFYKECKKAGMRALIGCEVYIVDDLTAFNPKEHRGHLVLIAKNNEGYTNLCKINAKAWKDGFYYKPRIDYDFLEGHSAGLVCLSGCLAGHIPHYLGRGMYDESKKYAERLKKMFGADFYIEIQDHGMQEQAELNPKLVTLAADIGAELIATNDVHYINADDAEMQDALMCVEMRKMVDDPERMRFPSDQFYMKTPAEMDKLFGLKSTLAMSSKDPEMVARSLSNTLIIAEKCDCHPFARADLLPDFAAPTGEDNVTYFRRIIEEGLAQKYGTITAEIRDRYESEFKVIHENKFVDYFLIVADLMKFANDNGIAVGPGRGSGAGSIIAYAINITLVDPLKYNLLFERFLHSERVSMPDFDLDFCCDRREEVISYVINKYGSDKVCQIVTFGTLAAKAAIKDIARVFRMPYSEVETLTKPIGFNPAIKPPVLPYVFDLKQIKHPKSDPKFSELGEKEQEKALLDYQKEKDKADELRKPELVNLYRNNAEIKKIVDMAVKVEGFPRNCSTHAAGVIVCKRPVGDVTPLQRNGNDITSQFDMKEIEELGMLKMDFLGLITLTDIQGAIEDIKLQTGKSIDFYDMEYTDPEIFKMIAAGDTDAVFQLESGGFKRFMKELRPDCFEDIIAGVALFRPGPMDMIPDYCRNKHDPTLTQYEHPLLEPILKNTYGQIIYQEQVMDIFKFLGGYSLGQADMVRRAMGKKDVKEMDRQRDIFTQGDPKLNISGAIANGVKKETAISIFNKMAKFAGYAFNKSHATCYAFLAYQTAYLKLYHYPFYMASVLNNRIGKWDDMTHYIVGIRAKNVAILPPDVNKSSTYFSVESVGGGTGIRFGLGAVKNVGVALIESILAERERGGAFKSFQDFCNRVEGSALNKKCLESLILSGAFDNLGAARAQLMAVYPSIVKLIQGDKRATDAGQLSMFQTVFKDDAAADVRLPDVAEYDAFTKSKHEREVVGLYLSGHPLDHYAGQLSEFGFNTSYIHKKGDEENADMQFPVESGQWSEDDEETAPVFANNAAITMGAIITDIKRVFTKAAKQEMAILKVEDMYGSCEVMLFPKGYEKAKAILAKDAVVKISGRLSIREGEEAIILAESIERLSASGSKDSYMSRTSNDESMGNKTPAAAALAEKLYLKYNTLDTAVHGDVMRVLGAYSGNIPVIIKCTVQNTAASPAMRVRNCKAVVYELKSILGDDCVVLK